MSDKYITCTILISSLTSVCSVKVSHMTDSVDPALWPVLPEGEGVSHWLQESVRQTTPL